MRRLLGSLLVVPLVAALIGVVVAENQTPAAASVSAYGQQSVTAIADAFTRHRAPRAHGGGALGWVTGGRSHAKHRGYVKFVLPAPPAGSEISSAYLSAYVEGPVAATRRGPFVFRTRNHWGEHSLSWRNQPVLGAQVGTRVDKYTSGRWMTWDVTRALTTKLRTQGGVVSFALVSGRRQVRFRSRESQKPPRVDFTTTAVPSMDPSPTAGGPGSPSDSPTPTPTETAPSGDGTQAATVFGWGPVVAGDEFNYTGAPSSAKWGVYDSVGHAGNGVRSPSAWNVDGSVVTVTGDSSGTTGGMSAKFGRRKYGRWEVRMRTNVRDPKYHPVLILWPDTSASTCPEIDFAEGSTDTGALSFYNHYGCGGVQSWGRQTIDTTQWHNYAVEWTPTAITGYVDGAPWFKDTNPDHQPPGSMHQTIQLDWFPDGTPTTKSWMQVNWVRVYNLG